MGNAAAIRVLIVDDSPSARINLSQILSPERGFEVVGAVASGEEAMICVRRLAPDVVTMDLGMAGMGGMEATRQIMQQTPVPIAIVSNMWNESGTEFSAIQAGALTVVEKPPGPGHPDRARTVDALVRALKQISGVRVVRRWALSPRPTGTAAEPGGPPSRQEMATAGASPARAPFPKALPRSTRPARMVAIGASTGGPPALSGILKSLPRGFPAPILVVQHTALGFLQNFMHWLEGEIHLPVELARHGELLQPGTVYFGPEDRHLGVDTMVRAIISNDAPEHGVKPSVSYLFRSVAQSLGPDAIGILLTGMGKDGARELGLMLERGAMTVAQDQASSVVHGMPGEAIRLGSARSILSLTEISQLLLQEKPL